MISNDNDDFFDVNRLDYNNEWWYSKAQYGTETQYDDVGGAQYSIEPSDCSIITETVSDSDCSITPTESLSDSDCNSSTTTEPISDAEHIGTDDTDYDGSVRCSAKNGRTKKYKIRCKSEIHVSNHSKKSRAKTLKGQYRAIATGLMIPHFLKTTGLKANEIIKNKKGCFVSKKRNKVGRQTASNPKSFLFTKNRAYALQQTSFQWTNKNGTTHTYKSVGRYKNNKLIPIYKKVEAI